jgi:hypothetical protein
MLKEIQKEWQKRPTKLLIIGQLRQYSKGNDASLRVGGPKHTLAGLNQVWANESAPSLAESPGSGPVGHAHYSALPGLHQARAPPLRDTTKHLSNTGFSQNDST